MTTSFPRVIIRAALIAALALPATNVFAQMGSSARSIPTEIEKMDVRVAQVITQAEARFKEGELHLKAGERLQAREKFDKAVDTILESGLDVRASQKLQTYYLELVERVFRLEVPQQQVTPRTELAQTNIQANYTGQSQQDDQEEPEVGFKQQKFEPSPLDEYAKLVLTDTEIEVDPERLSPTSKSPRTYSISRLRRTR